MKKEVHLCDMCESNIWGSRGDWVFIVNGRRLEVCARCQPRFNRNLNVLADCGFAIEYKMMSKAEAEK
jgi:ribosome-binding protein aMBF1 (putative translation factor)